MRMPPRCYAQFTSSKVIPHFAINKIVDHIGAGDALSGAIVAALAWGCPFHHALIWGAIAVSKSTAQSFLFLFFLRALFLSSFPPPTNAVT